MTVNFDKLRKIGSLAGWQRRIYNFIIDRLGPTYLLKIMNFVHDKVTTIVPDGTDPEEVKEIIKLALIDYVDSSM
jgi:hypothetical protein